MICMTAGIGIGFILAATVDLPVNEDAWLTIFMVLGGVASLFTARWLTAAFTSPPAALAIEEKANYDTKGAAAARMLVIRGVDDEASLSLAAGSIGSRLSYLVLVVVIPAMYTTGVFLSLLIFLLWWSRLIVLNSAAWVGLLMLGCFFAALIFFFVPGVFKSFFGREFLVSGMSCDIAVDLVPDTVDRVEAITLGPVEDLSKSEWYRFAFVFEFQNPISYYRSLWRTGEALKGVRLSKSSWQLRHGIYNHPDCVDEFVRWLRRVT